MAAVGPYPVQFSVEYPDYPRNRLTVFFRPLLALPILIILILLGGLGYQAVGARGLSAVATAVPVAVALMIIFRQKYPRWWFDWLLNLLRFQNRVGAYLMLLRDEYPSTDEDQAVTLEIPYPDASRDLNRWLPLVKWLLALPHYIILAILSIIAIIVVIIAWFVILFTGRYPGGMFNFVVGVLRWSNRVTTYAYLLTTDRYPPFRLEE